MLAAARVLAGVSLMIAPRPALRAWVGPTPGGSNAVAARALGARDAALGWGTLRALEKGDAPGTWVLASAGADGVDAVASLLAPLRGGTTSGRRGLVMAMIAGGSAVAGALAGRRISEV